MLVHRSRRSQHPSSRAALAHRNATPPRRFSIVSEYSRGCYPSYSRSKRSPVSLKLRYCGRRKWSTTIMRSTRRPAVHSSLSRTTTMTKNTVVPQVAHLMLTPRAHLLVLRQPRPSPRSLKNYSPAWWIYSFAVVSLYQLRFRLIIIRLTILYGTRVFCVG